ncbi:Hsp20/alpha crystallin family protein [Roseiconus nitratireducens]|nr:Hsp20/alpha crystallin family protein [Roseiconus nitratireducens]
MTTNQDVEARNGEHQVSDPKVGSEQTFEATFAPRFDIWEGDDELVLYGDLPGVDPDSLDIEFENRQLTIHGKTCRKRASVNHLYSEYEVGDFHRTFTIGEAIDSAKISAELHQGVLALHLPKAAEARPRRIQVKTA